MFNSTLLKNKIALVTGASRGIGQAIALALGQAGATVIGTATTQAGADNISRALADAGVTGLGLAMNVTSAESIETAIATIKATYAPVNILINNAAVNQDNLLLRMKEEEWFKVLDTDLHSIYRLSKACVRDMLKARFGRIINIGSVVGSTGNPGQVNYCAAKAGILGFSKALALEVGSRDITINTVSPGFIETDMTAVLTQEQRDAIYQRIPMQKMGTVADIAWSVLFLASPAASYITGQNLHVNGGMYMD